MKKGNLFAVLCGMSLSLGIAACSDSSSTQSTPSDQENVQEPVDDNGGNTTGGNTTGGSTVGTTTALAATADPSRMPSLYPAWQGAHYVTYEQESAAYPSHGAEFGEVFGSFVAAGKFPARIIWSSQTNVGCKIPDAIGTPMLKRGCTVSEGIGYGMLITLFQGDMDAYNRLWYYDQGYRITPYGNQTGLLPWLTNTFHWDVLDGSSATDADLDVATSLIIAYYRTQNIDPVQAQEYLNDALALITAIWDKEINTDTYYIYSGDTPTWHTADPIYNLSYFSPVALRLFAKVDPNHNWTAVLDAMYAYAQKVQDGGTGVFPDWSNTAGVAVNPNNNSADKTYWTFNKETVRLPWRLAWDYYWFKDERAAAILNKLNAFISSRSNGNPAEIPAVNYSWDPAMADVPMSGALQTHWLGAWCLTGIAAADNAWLNNCTAIFNTKDMGLSNSSYFIDMLYMMMGQLLNGNYEKPAALD